VAPLTPWETGYALQPAVPQWGIQKTLEWAKGVWARQAELMPSGHEADPKMGGKRR
jgi:hypothetical protein